ncbi:unnamed protein product [Periconia digitata]|uniref:Cupin type-2 domain-containing protein n=1 Tax=Periconia digitata TaxID=1303443 RepID=A0A9W4UKH2_9PLEO|nr:unnamed protein product [Periconia digitata]
MEDYDAKALATMDMPRRPINFVAAKAGEVLKLGHITCRVLEDGSKTDNRLGAAELILPPHTSGPPAHWHEMHDESFLITAGTIRFHTPDRTHSDAVTGDYITVPTRAPHTFSNPFDVEARTFFTCTPAFYIDYFKILALASKGDVKMSKEKNLEIMARYATMPAKPMLEDMAREAEGKNGN